MDDQEKFKRNMEKAGYKVEDYNGRWFYHGWAVRCEREEEQAVIRATKVRLQKDQMGLGLIIYPSRGRC
jgi:ribosomal protein S21